MALDRLTGDDLDPIRVQLTGQYLTDEARRWYDDTIDSLEGVRNAWNFEQVICALYRRFIHRSTARTAADQFNRLPHAEVDQLIAEAQEPWRGLEAVNRLCFWASRASGQGYERNAAERHLVRVWRPPRWWLAHHQPARLAEAPKPPGQSQPAPNAPAQEWVEFLKRHPKAYIRGVKCNEDGTPIWSHVQGYVWMNTWADLPSKERQRLRDALWGIVAPIFAKDQYKQALADRGLRPARNMAMVPYNGVVPPTIDSALTHLAVQCGLTNEHVAPSLQVWADEWLAAGNAPGADAMELDDRAPRAPAAAPPTAAPVASSSTTTAPPSSQPEPASAKAQRASKAIHGLTERYSAM
ncbi:hypothetical protein GSI_03366 [Ganoderma sinense ZZ0214-1]|uniref:Uncharacterized protein n=1 Tax=Ganoderma sinense ZZ0214-1 TaxID=1077348 RepID=A0A2G8SLE5_9APHY|nr:hypothetical protein GSI_03366 [Ganoderma sinense ZZ0214-1]